VAFGHVHGMGINPADDRLFGYDSSSGVLKVTGDRRTWTDIARMSSTWPPTRRGCWSPMAAAGCCS
jgi:hypothetical protein